MLRGGRAGKGGSPQGVPVAGPPPPQKNPHNCSQQTLPVPPAPWPAPVWPCCTHGAGYPQPPVSVPLDGGGGGSGAATRSCPVTPPPRPPGPAPYRRGGCRRGPQRGPPPPVAGGSRVRGASAPPPAPPAPRPPPPTAARRRRRHPPWRPPPPRPSRPRPPPAAIPRGEGREGVVVLCRWVPWLQGAGPKSGGFCGWRGGRRPVRDPGTTSPTSCSSPARCRGRPARQGRGAHRVPSSVRPGGTRQRSRGRAVALQGICPRAPACRSLPSRCGHE